MEETSQQELDIEILTVIKLLGRGATGKVFLVFNPITDPSSLSPFAVKLVDTSRHPSFRRRALCELSVLRRLSTTTHPFLPTLLSSSSSSPNLAAWSTPFCSGGDLNALRRRTLDHVFSLQATRFYAAEIASAIAHLHKLGIVYRDLKPENVLIQSSGHLTLTDFDLSHHLPPPPPPPPRRRGRLLSDPARITPAKPRIAGCRSFVGTEEYVSPEVVKGEGHGFGVDWWAFGVVVYEMVYGETPFKGRNRKETYANVVLKKPEFKGRRTALIEMMEKLLEKDPKKRLGNGGGGAKEVQEHEFFSGVRWDLVPEILRPPYVPAEEEYELGGERVGIRDYLEKEKLFRSCSEVSQSPSSSSSEEEGGGGGGGSCRVRR